jgi:polyhydroxyalkanoate synthase subunit PhaC
MVQEDKVMADAGNTLRTAKTSPSKGGSAPRRRKTAAAEPLPAAASEAEAAAPETKTPAAPKAKPAARSAATTRAAPAAPATPATPAARVAKTAKTAKAAAPKPAAQVVSAKAAAPKPAKPAARPPAKPPVAEPAPAALRPEAEPEIEAEAEAAEVVSDKATSEALDESYELHLIDPVHRETIEQLSLNLAKAALTAQSAIAEMALSHADRPRALTPDPFNVAPAMTEVMARLVSHPDRLFLAQADLFGRYMDLWQAAARRATGEATEPVITPAKGDKRFSHPEWTENPVFDVVKQSYLLTADWLNNLVSSVETSDPLTRRRAEFFTKLLTDAFSPTNFLASNPAALEELLLTRGESLVRGMQRFAADLERGSGQLSISQTDYERFTVGENVATAPGEVVWRDELFELLQFRPTTERVYEIPLLIFPPWINKYYVLDLRAENSMIRWLTSQGFTVFLVSWINPDSSLAERGFADYMTGGIYKAVAKTLEQAGTDRVNTVGYCIGGTLLGATLAHMAAKGDERIGSATFFAAQHDFSEAGDLLLFTDERWLHELERRMDEAGGVLPGAAMAETFNALRANDLVWSFFVNNYLMGKEPPAFDLLYWNSDQTRMPKALHLFYLRRFYGENALANGRLELGGVRLNLKDVTIPLYFQASREDHIAPARSVYRSARLFGGPVTVTLAGSGHIAGVVNPPAARKYQHWENPDLPASFEEWLAGAVEKPGSWWPRWAEWLAERSGGTVPARDPQAGPLKPIEPAPGSYVMVKS